MHWLGCRYAVNALLGCRTAVNAPRKDCRYAVNALLGCRTAVNAPRKDCRLPEIAGYLRYTVKALLMVFTKL